MSNQTTFSDPLMPTSTVSQFSDVMFTDDQLPVYTLTFTPLRNLLNPPLPFHPAKKPGSSIHFPGRDIKAILLTFLTVDRPPPVISWIAKTVTQ
jgi:hypothetical protein